MSVVSNFSFLSKHAPLLAELGLTAEKLFPFDPASSVLKLRLLAEADRLMPSLLAKAFRGELVPQDPNKESASELLKRLAGSAQVSAAKRAGRKATSA